VRTVGRARCRHEFLCPDASAPHPSVLRLSSIGLNLAGGAPPSHSAGAVCYRRCPSLASARRHFSRAPLSPRQLGMTADDLSLGAIVARGSWRAWSSFHFCSGCSKRPRRRNVLRLARDLHDSLLHTRGAALQTEIVRRLLDQDHRRPGTLTGPSASARYRATTYAFSSETEARPLSLLRRNFHLAARLHELGVQIERQWGLCVALHLSPWSRDSRSPGP